MVFENIEKLKQDFTDKFVVVDETRPELRRFGGQTGQVKTVNMSGRALVQFDAYENIGWIDIDVDFLKVVDGPPAKSEPAEKKAPKKAAAKPAAAPTTKKAAAAKKAADPKKAPASGGKMSVADILAAARTGGQKSAETAASQPKASTPGKADPKKMSVAEMLAAARAEKSGGGTPTKTATQSPPAKSKTAPAAAPAADPKKMSVADILAAARAEKTSEGVVAAPVDATSHTEGSSSTESEAEPEAVESKPAPVGNLPTETADILAWCRQRDGG